MLFPPTLKSTQTAFLATTSSYDIAYSIGLINSPNEIKIDQIEIKVVNQASNTTALKGDAISFKRPYASNTQSFSITSDEVTWRAGLLYKVQIRLVNEAAGVVSEWSNVMVIKAIDPPTVAIINAQSRFTDTSTEYTETTITPLFAGSYECETEAEERFKFDLYTSEGDLIESSGWVLHTLEGDTWRAKQQLEDLKAYYVEYQVKTTNGYVATAEAYPFIVTEVYLDKLAGVRADGKADPEEGTIKVTVTSESDLLGNYVLLRRAAAGPWEEVKYYNLSSSANLAFVDYTVEDGVEYTYAFSQITKTGLRTEPVITSPIVARLDYAYLYRNGKQVKLKFNNKMSSFKHTTLRNKVDTLGNRYARISQNGDANYAEFPITGLITALTEQDIPSQKRPDNFSALDTNLTQDNFYAERKYREEVEDFLLAYEPCLYRSPSEGNLIVALMNISMTPKQELGRMLFEFSSTAYEVYEASLDNMNTYGIIDIGEIKDLSELPVDPTIGQLKDIEAPADLFALIAKTSPDQILVDLTCVWFDYADDAAVNGNTIFKINDQTVVMKPNFHYHLDTSITSLELVSSPTKILVNYTARFKNKPSESTTVVSQIDTTRAWGQIVGEISGDVLNTIQVDARKQVASLYGAEDFGIDEEGNYYLTYKGDRVYYLFNRVIEITIEAAAGDEFTIDGNKILMGATEKLNLNYNVESLVANGTYNGLINYCVLTNQVKEVEYDV